MTAVAEAPERVRAAAVESPAEWARRMAASLPPFTAEEAEFVGHIASQIDTLQAMR